jgi:hypothetical protein
MQITFRANPAKWAAFNNKAQSLFNPMTPGPYRDGLLAASDAEHAELRQRFESASAQDGTWQVLKPATIREKLAAGYDDSILYRTSALEKSLQRGEENHVLEVTPNGVIEGTEDPKARYHQDGAPENNLPARPIVVEPTDEALDAMRIAMVEGVALTMKEAAK